MKIEKGFQHIIDVIKKNKTEQNDSFKNKLVGLISFIKLILYQFLALLGITCFYVYFNVRANLMMENKYKTLAQRLLEIID